MLYNVYLLRYNNYFNRIVKKKNTLAEYSDFIVNTFSGVNFNYADGVSTELVVNIDDDTSIDYLISEYNGYINRWFVIEAYKNRNGQYKLTLQRDVMADYWDIIAEAPCFIQKGTLNNNDPFIFNDEGMVFNQIKKGETLLKDGSNSAWIVGYVPHVTGSSSTWIRENTIQAANPVPESTFTSTEEFSTNTEYRVAVVSYYNEYTMYYNNHDERGIYKSNKMVFRQNQITERGNDYQTSRIRDGLNTINSISEADVNTSSIDYQLSTSYSSYLYCPVDSTIATLSSWNEGRVVKDLRTNELYSVHVSSVNQDIDGTYGTYTNINNAINTFITNLGVSGSATANNFTYSLHREIKTITFVPLQYSNYKFTMPSDNKRPHVLDAPYDMFCMPYSNMAYQITGQSAFQCNKDTNLSIASFLSSAIGAENLYDIQLLPYCPCPEFIASNHLVINDSSYVTLIKDSDGNNVSGFVWCRHSNFTCNVGNPVGYTYTGDRKVRSSVYKYRLCSPNYNGIFEFDPYKFQYGTIKYSADCTYKPYQPYIHVNPDFKGLYGSDFNDVRGLICGGDFSIASVSSSFTEYELQNKNYQQIFDRQIQHMDYNNKMNLISSIGTGAISALSTSVSAGVMGGVGTGVAMGVGSAVGLAVDTALGQLSYQESKSYNTDLYNYSMGNVQALPYSLSKTSAINYNNKLFPFIEWYSASDKEIQAFENKLKYNGMTVNRIDNINNFVYNDETYIQGVIIRLDDLHDDYHLCVNIVDRVKQGFFVKREDVS